ncbi:MAG TPA: methionine adenosyltransferase, partial [Desulfovibrio sp.]|nr:methionine adenosyltransferase [Desulfovibrio sp.]
KDATKVDRSAAYAARYVAKNIVAAGLASRCEVAIAYAIGQPYPEMINLNTFETCRVNPERLDRVVKDIFPFSVAGMIEELSLLRPQFRKTAAYGHFGREAEGFGWEKTDKVELLQSYF